MCHTLNLTLLVPLTLRGKSARYNTVMDNKFLYNNKVFRERRKELRNNQTKAEKILWKIVSKNKVLGLRFFRQYSVGPYILDFYCPKIRLSIEVDGNVHSDEKAIVYDKDREKYLKGLDIKIIRFWNDDVLKNTKEIRTKIQNVVEKLNRVE